MKNFEDLLWLYINVRKETLIIPTLDCFSINIFITIVFFFFLGLSFKDGSVLFPRGFLVTSQTQKDSKHEIPSLQEIL